MQHGDSLVLTLVAAFVLAFVLGMVALRLRLSPLLGYLAAGVVVGPFTPGFVADGSIASQMAELGVILLMFGVGLHFSPEDLIKVRSAAVPGAVLQIALGTALGLGLGLVIGLPAGEAALLGLALSIASTVIVLRTFEERKTMKTEVGRTAIGWLVVQDLLVIAAMVLLPLAAAGHDLGTWASAGEIGWRLAKIAIFVALMFVVGGRVLPWVLIRIAHARSRELFTLGVLAIALGIAWLAYAAFGASFALGAFVAGLVLNGSPLGHNAGERALPFRDAFAVLFFVSVGMLLDPRTLIEQPLAIAGAVGVVLVSGALAALIVARLAKLPAAKAAVLAAAMPQIGEFSFVLAGLGVTLGVMSGTSHSLIVAAAILTIAINPALLWLADRLETKGAESATATPG